MIISRIEKVIKDVLDEAEMLDIKEVSQYTREMLTAKIVEAIAIELDRDMDMIGDDCDDNQMKALARIGCEERGEQYGEDERDNY